MCHLWQLQSRHLGPKALKRVLFIPAQMDLLRLLVQHQRQSALLVAVDDSLLVSIPCCSKLDNRTPLIESMFVVAGE